VSIAQSRLHGVLVSLSNVDDEYATLCSVTLELGCSLGAISSITASYVHADSEFLGGPFLEQIGMAESIRDAFQNRKMIKDKYIRDADSLSDSYQRLQMNKLRISKLSLCESDPEVTRIERQLHECKNQNESMLRRKDEILESSDRLFDDYLNTKLSCISEIQAILITFVHRHIEQSMRTKTPLASFLDKHEFSGDVNAEADQLPDIIL
jgi:hypothetical protein